MIAFQQCSILLVPGFDNFFLSYRIYTNCSPLELSCRSVAKTSIQDALSQDVAKSDEITTILATSVVTWVVWMSPLRCDMTTSWGMWAKWRDV